MRYSFEEVCKFKAGEDYCESCQFWDINFTVKNDPVVTEDKVSFIGICEDGVEIDYLITKGFEHYGPKIYNKPQY